MRPDERRGKWIKLRRAPGCRRGSLRITTYYLPFDDSILEALKHKPLSHGFTFSSFGSILLAFILGTVYIAMRIIAKKTLKALWESHPDAEEPLLAWYREVEKEDWDTPAKVKAKYGKASIVGDNRVVFNIKGNDYRLVVKINYPYRVVYIRFVGTHAEYDAINVEEV